MNNLLSPYDLGKFQTIENCQKLSINKLVRTATKELKKRIIEAHIEALGVSVNLTVSKSRFNGERFWFICPQCARRVGIILYDNLGNKIGCRKCLGFLYKIQRYKNMVECA